MSSIDASKYCKLTLSKSQGGPTDTFPTISNQYGQIWDKNYIDVPQ